MATVTMGSMVVSFPTGHQTRRGSWKKPSLGFLHETKADAQIAMDAENARLTGSGRTSQYTFTRDGDPVGDEIALMEPIEFNDPLQDIVNVVTVPIRTFEPGAEATLWESGLVPFAMAAAKR